MTSTTTTTLLLLLLLLLLPSLHSLPSFESSLIHQSCLGTSDYPSCTSLLRTQTLHSAAHIAINEALRSLETLSTLSPLPTTLRELSALQDCKDLLDLSLHQIAQSLPEIPRPYHNSNNLRSYLSAALTNQDTCLQGFDGTDGRLLRHVRGGLDELTQLVRNLLEVQRRVDNETRLESDGMPGWLGEEEVEMLGRDPREMEVDAVVAKDGTGGFRTVREAVEGAPSRGVRRYVIYVKRGVYRENVELKRKKSNVMIVGEGMGVTVITGNRNFMQGWTTFRTATFGEFGRLISWGFG